MWATIWKMRIDAFLWWIKLAIHSPEIAIHTWGMMQSKVAKRFIKSLNLNKEEQKELRYAIFMHDIGKLGVTKKILAKNGRLSDEEYNEIKRHPEIGGKIISRFCKNIKVQRAIIEHHERLDGSGYPQGLRGDKISYYARIIMLLDTFDVMSVGRRYQKKLDISYVVSELEKMSGTKHDKALSRLLIDIIKKQEEESVWVRGRQK